MFFTLNISAACCVARKKNTTPQDLLEQSGTVVAVNMVGDFHTMWEKKFVYPFSIFPEVFKGFT